ncbi:hypothetical protein JIN77_13220 [Verrucomicrobiaceae bacterium R5-34]|nr:hypothetical protein [Verrucomicrobiaceae bacterium R5-34]
MKSLSLFFFLALLLASAQAATPKMWVKTGGNRIPLRIDTIKADVTITGSIAETVLTLRFRNETNRMQEGEFVMPLPEGSTVSQYALEVNGALRDGVAVEKKQARHAYETIKRQMIDPGIVEREAGNIYRTKVFPIPAKGTKLVRIAYIEHLTEHQGKLHYSLPTDYPGLINDFRCTIQHNGEASIKAPGLSFKATARNSSQASATNQILPKTIAVTCPQNAGSRAWLERHGNRSYFLINTAKPADIKERKRIAPKHINLIWDASESRSYQPLKQQLEILDRYFKKIPNTRVTLQILRNTLQDGGTYQIKESDWKRLRTTLENILYDGATHYPSVAQLQKEADLTLLFTDGDFAQNLTLNTQQNSFIFHSSNVSNINPVARNGLVETINWQNLPIEKVIHQMTHTQFKMQPLKLPSLTVIAKQVNDRQILLGRCDGEPTDFTVSYRNANRETIRQNVSTSTNRLDGTSLIKRFWAQEQLGVLERSSGDQKRIIAHCREHGLVSDHTSLIVLERFRDYVRFNIPPPEPEIKARWKIARKKFNTKTPSPEEHNDRINAQWYARLSWYQKTYSWFSESMMARAQQTSIWMNAVDQVFAKSDLDLQTYAVIETWQRKTKALAAADQELKSGKGYDDWNKQQIQLMKDWDKFSKLQPKRKPGQPLAISVRGLVLNPDTYRSDEPLTLKQSLDLAGGPSYLGSLQYVSLYRNAGVLTYNLLSEQYRDVTLKPGDMIVVEPEPYDSSGDVDPFFAGDDSPKVDPRKAPAVTQKQPRYTTLGGGAGADPFGGGKSTASDADDMAIKITRPVAAELNTEAMKRFEQSLQSREDAQRAYAALKEKQEYTRSFYIDAARILAKHGHTDLAEQVLSNIMENRSSSDSMDRAFAYWLGDIGLLKPALAKLMELRKSDPSNAINQLDVIRYRHQLEPTWDAATAYHDLTFLTSTRATQEPRILALTERNAYSSATQKKTYQKHTQNLSTDLRCVIYCADPSVKFSTTTDEPDSNRTTRWSDSRQGGKISVYPGMHEYMLKRAMPGTYTIKCNARQPVTVQVALYSHWGKPEQSCQWSTILLGREDTTAAEYTLEFKR